MSPNDCFHTTHRIERTCAGCGSATVKGDFRARIIGQLAEPIAPDWTAQGWEISVFHNLWARQLGVLNMTEKDIEIRAWLQKLSPRIESWSSKTRIKVNVLPSTIYSWPIQPGVLATSTWVHQAGSELHHWQGRTFVLECTFHCAVVDGEHLLIPYYDFEPHAVSIWDRAPAILFLLLLLLLLHRFRVP
ncbi:hypothetical protein C8J57DRAFT_1218610 [Mycena rebaudengoi]|nr:hypothetical protein C8J57DRAFT_1218610 [Mycena rebaudengoi]